MQLTEEETLAQVLKTYQKQIEIKISKSIPLLSPKSPLRDACEYALVNGGKRFRPALVLMIAKALNNPVDVSDAALAVEFFHTASLIADDLPCMDDDDERRQKPSLHKVSGEAVALLASYALIAAGYECLSKNARTIENANLPFSQQSDRICFLALENAAYNTGLMGATGGQFLDLFPPNLSLQTISDAIRKKTVSLFEISFVLGWLYSGGEIKMLPLVKKAATHFGMAFQIADDIDDMEQDVQNGSKVNMAVVCGEEAAKKMFHEEITHFTQTLKQLNLDVPEFKAMTAYLAKGL